MKVIVSYQRELEKGREREKFSPFIYGCLHALYETVTSEISYKSL